MTYALRTFALLAALGLAGCSDDSSSPEVGECVVELRAGTSTYTVAGNTLTLGTGAEAQTFTRVGSAEPEAPPAVGEWAAAQVALPAGGATLDFSLLVSADSVTAQGHCAAGASISDVEVTVDAVVDADSIELLETEVARDFFDLPDEQ